MNCTVGACNFANCWRLTADCCFDRREKPYMETKYYTVTKIEGEYAYILEDNTENEIFIAMALLPEGVDIGTRLKYEMFSYEIIS